MNMRIVLVVLVITTTTLATVFFPPIPRLVWNASPSVPVGLYVIRPAKHYQRGDLIAANPPSWLAKPLAERGYLPRGVPLLKFIAATMRQRVCRFGNRITIDGKTVGFARDLDSKGRPLMTWKGCHTLGDGEVFLMNFNVSDSLDGRYFQTFRAAYIVGHAVPVWTDEAGDGHHVWFSDSQQKSPTSQPEGD
jgi:conjugative transfer signal peptidase TraF